MDGSIEHPFSALELEKTTKFRLAPGEELIICPYDMSHIVTNHRMTVHIVKCRRNYEKAMKANAEMVPMMACKYNWAHQIPVPELIYHEMTCPDRLSLITHIIEFSEPDPANKDKLKQFTREIYMTRGVPFTEVRPVHKHNTGVLPDDSVLSNHLIPKKVTTPRQKETFEPPQLRLKTVPKASHVNVRSIVSTGSKSSAKAATFYPPGETPPNSGRTSIGATDGSGASNYQEEAFTQTGTALSRLRRPLRGDPAVSRYYFDTKDNEDDMANYEWELDPPLKPYNPLKRFETDLLLKYPPNMSKSERKAWKNANVQKVKDLYGGQLFNVAPADPPPGVFNNH